VAPGDQLVLLFEKTQEGKSLLRYTYTVELHLSGHWLSGSASPFGWICPQFYKNNLPWNYRLSDQVHYSVMASRTSNQAWSKGLNEDTHCPIVTAELQTANIAYLQSTILLQQRNQLNTLSLSQTLYCVVILYISVSQTFIKWGPLLFVRMFYGPPYSCPLWKQIV
jgi:hypothetical protein